MTLKTKKTMVLTLIGLMVIVGIFYYSTSNTIDFIIVTGGYLALFALIVSNYFTEEWRCNVWLFPGRILCTFLILYAISPHMLYYKGTEHLVVFLPCYLTEFIRQIKREKRKQYFMVTLATMVVVALMPFKAASKVDRAIETFVAEQHSKATSVTVRQGFPTTKAKRCYIVVSVWHNGNTNEQDFTDYFFVYEEDTLKINTSL